ncbi:hypothetical protein Glove_330g113 [Diversispora epigaea]|uniref:Uncharacterized protein n=1 Tax=Diversispora epigaea TaxID=1348612 RepID=A0A397HJT6_9GLOM|nr:hypothetical protein Glove_330g113 [Diversispora epigaea]
MSTFCNSYSSRSNVSRINKPESGEPFLCNNSTFVVYKPDEELTKLRRLWWEEGNIHPQAKWEDATLPYILFEEITLEYEKHTDKWFWGIIYELPSKLLLVRFPSSLIRVGVLLTILMPVSEVLVQLVTINSSTVSHFGLYFGWIFFFL